MGRVAVAKRLSALPWMVALRSINGLELNLNND
ncbi:MAG: hypothetical protein ACI854_002072 [Arenicella sp.]|jgi:hypothetical protein